VQGERTQPLAERAHLLWKERGVAHLFEEPGARETNGNTGGEWFASPPAGGRS
jgi:hypothetical protein